MILTERMGGRAAFVPWFLPPWRMRGQGGLWAKHPFLARMLIVRRDTFLWTDSHYFDNQASTP
jgi:hypothetical protein